MKGRRALAFLALAAAQLLLPLGLVAWEELELAAGEEVRLVVEPVDPEDPFRGQYVTLNYDISTIDFAGEVEEGDTVYVPLFRDGNVWNGFSARTEAPDGETFIRGRVRSSDDGQGQVEYGIETFFVEEGKGPEYERLIGSGRLVAVVSLEGDGEAKLKRLEAR